MRLYSKCDECGLEIFVGQKGKELIPHDCYNVGEKIICPECYDKTLTKIKKELEKKCGLNNLLLQQINFKPYLLKYCGSIDHDYYGETDLYIAYDINTKEFFVTKDNSEEMVKIKEDQVVIIAEIFKYLVD